MRYRVFSVAVVAGVMVASVAAVRAAEITIERVALTGDQWDVPLYGVEAVGKAVLDNQGNVYFSATVGGDNAVLARASDGGQQTVVAPTGSTFFDPSAASAGRVVVVDGLNTKIAVWTIGGGAALNVATVRDNAPTFGPTEQYTVLTASPAMNSSGKVAYAGNYAVGTDVPAFWSGTAGATGMVVDGASASWTGLGAVVTLQNERVIAGGTTAVLGTNFVQDGIWKNGTLIVESADLAGAGIPTERITGLGINAAEKIAFRATTEPISENQRIYTVDSVGHLSLVANAGDLYSGVGTFKTFEDPLINAAGSVVFGGNREGDLAGIAIYGIDGLKIIASEGAAVGLSGMHFLDDKGEGTPFSQISINAAGQVVFKGLLDDPIYTAGIFLWDPSLVGQELSLIARVGDTLAAAGGLEIADLRLDGISGGEDGVGASLNDAGQILFHADFATGVSGAFLVSPVGAAIPEAGTLALLGLGGLALGRRRR